MSPTLARIVFIDIVLLFITNTVWITEQSFFHLLHAHYDICRAMEIGVFLLMNARELQRFVLQIIHDCDDNDYYCAVPLIIKFLVPNAYVPQHQECCSTVSCQIQRAAPATCTVTK